MKVQVVSFNCVLKNKFGQVISSTVNHDVITHGQGQGDLLSALAEGLHDLKTGEKRKIVLSAEQAYGFYDPDKVMVVSREELARGDKLRAGDQVLFLDRDGSRKKLRIVQASREVVTLDGNHPLAGQDLIFEIEAISAREATPDEIAEASGVAEPGQLLH